MHKGGRRGEIQRGVQSVWGTAAGGTHGESPQLAVEMGAREGGGEASRAGGVSSLQQVAALEEV